MIEFVKATIIDAQDHAPAGAQAGADSRSQDRATCSLSQLRSADPGRQHRRTARRCRRNATWSSRPDCPAARCARRCASCDSGRARSRTRPGTPRRFGRAPARATTRSRKYVGLFVQGRGISLMSLLQVARGDRAFASPRLAAANRTNEDLAELIGDHANGVEDAFAERSAVSRRERQLALSPSRTASHNELLNAFHHGDFQPDLQGFRDRELRDRGGPQGRDQGAPAHPGRDRRTRRRCRQPPDGAPPGRAHQANAGIRAGTGRPSLKAARHGHRI